MELITGTLGALKAATDLISSVGKFKNEADVLQVKSELMDLIFKARSDLMALQTEHDALLRRCANLEQQLLQKDSFAQEKQHYSLYQFEAGGIVYRFNPPTGSNVPVHDLCTNCYNQNIKSMLQFAGIEKYAHKYSCPNCLTNIVGDRVNMDAIFVQSQSHWSDY